MKRASGFSLPHFTILWALAVAASAAEREVDSRYVVIERGQHHQVWSRVVSYTDEFGQVRLRTNSFTQLSAGLNRQVNGRWVESAPELVITNNEVIGRGAGHELRVAGNLNTRGAVQVRLPSGEWLKSSILGLAYHDTASQSNVLIAKLKDSTAQVFGSNQTRVVFFDAFTDFKADVTYEYRKSGVAQLVTLRERPPLPEEYGLSSATTHLLILSEFIEAPTPQVREQFLRSGNDTLRDDALEFSGGMRMGRGRAFAEGNGRSQFNLPISKQWELLSGRRVLVERVSCAQIEDELLRLPPAGGGITNAAVNKPTRWFAKGELPASKTYSAVEARPVQQTAALKPRDGFVLDWELVYYGSGYFFCGNTYLVEGEMHLDSLWAEPGAFVKFTPGSWLQVDGFVQFYPYGWNGWDTTVFTSVNDDDPSHGEVIEGYSNGNPQPGEYGPALVVQPEYLWMGDYSTCFYASACVAGIAPPASVTVSASDPHATKGGDTAAFTMSRVNGDWNQALQVQYTVSGTAVAGTDYQSIGTSATIPANQGSVVVPVTALGPLGPSGGAYDSSVVLAIQPSANYELGTTHTVGVTVYDPSIVLAAAPVPNPSGLIGWWRGENNATDGAGANNGTLGGNTIYGWGKVGQAFGFDGQSDGVRLGNPAALRLQNLTIETWIKRSSTAIVTYEWHGTAGLLCYGYGGYGLGIWNDGRLFLTRAGIDNVSTTARISDTEWHHVAVTKSGNSVVFYIDGVAQSVPAYNSTFTFNTAVAIGARGDNLDSSFLGSIDEMSFYNRALSLAEIQILHTAGRAGKFLDTDADGLPDSWEQLHFGNLSQTSGADYDTDGLTNLQEYQQGTNPIQPDTDGDGLTDGYEYNTTLTNPALADTGSTGTSDGYKDSDGDGLTNLEEFNRGSNPRQPNVASPIFSPLGGTYASAQNVTITCPTAGASLRYSLDGSEPTLNYPGSPIAVGPNQTLKAKAVKGGWLDSAVETQGYFTAANNPPSVTIAPPSASFKASDSIELLVEAEDSDGTITKVRLVRNSLVVAEAASSPLRFTLANVPAGSYTFKAQAIDDDGAVGESSTVTMTIAASGPVVSLVGVQPFFTSSPGTLVANITGVNPGALTTLTLNGVPITPRAGEFLLNVSLVEGENIFTLVATDNQSRTAQASTKVYLDSVSPVVSITAPANNSSFTTDRINVSGTFTEASLKQMTVNGVLAFISGTTFEALNVLLAEGANAITATAEDIAGNQTTASINVTGSATPVDPIQLNANPVGGFVSLQVTFTPQSAAPGTLQQVLYDFNGDNVTDQTAANLNPITHTYTTAGEYFPVVTVQTSVGKFSSLGGWNAWNPDRLRINVQPPPVQDSVINVTDPFDIKVSAAGDLYVLSKSTATIRQYNAGGTLVRSLAGIGNGPHCLDVDAQGNVYVPMTLDGTVWKFKPDGGAFAPDTTFNGTGWIGSAGSGDGQFAYPYGVAVSRDGEEIAVADQLNHRIQRFSKTGVFLGKFGEYGSALGQFDYPRGLAYDETGMLYIADSGNNRIVLALASGVVAASGTAGGALGQFQQPLNVRVGSRGIYVADYGNNRIQYFDPTESGHDASLTPFAPRGALSSQLSLNLPRAVAPIPDLLTEKIYIADTGNNRVLKVTLPEAAVPDTSTWNPMKTSLLAGNIDQAVSHFSIASAEDYRRSFISIGATAISSVMNKTLTPAVINRDSAQYYFEDTTIIPGETITFPVGFVKENGVWKILEF